MYRTNTVPYLLALLASACYAAWAILSLILVNGNGVSFAVSLDSIYISFAIMAWVLVLLFAKERGFFDRAMIRTAVTEGLCYTGGTAALFYAFTYAKAFPLTEVISYSSIILFAFMVRHVNRSRTGLRYFLFTLIAFAGIAAIAFSVYGSGFSFNISYLLSILAVAILYGLAAYYTFYPMKMGYNPFAYQAVGITTQVTLVSGAVFLFGLRGQLIGLGAGSWSYAALIGALLIVGYLSELRAFKIAKKAKAGVIDTINILTNLELVGIAIFSVFYLSLSWLYIAAGTALILIGTVFLQKEG